MKTKTKAFDIQMVVLAVTVQRIGKGVAFGEKFYKSEQIYQIFMFDLD